MNTALDSKFLALSDATLREAGLSRSKSLYVRDLAAHFETGKLNPRQWRFLSDEALIERLVEVKGIGRWTAEMFLIFNALRADVWPIDDLGLRRALALHYNDGEPLPPDRMREIGLRWAPWRSVATWYLWRRDVPLAVPVAVKQRTPRGIR